MGKERKSKANRYSVRMALGHGAEVELDSVTDSLSIRCNDSGLTARMQTKEKIEAEYFRHDGTLIVGAWMAIQIQCSAEEAAEFAKAIGRPGGSSLEFLG